MNLPYLVYLILFFTDVQSLFSRFRGRTSSINSAQTSSAFAAYTVGFHIRSPYVCDDKSVFTCPSTQSRRLSSVGAFPCLGVLSVLAATDPLLCFPSHLTASFGLLKGTEFFPSMCSSASFHWLMPTKLDRHDRFAHCIGMQPLFEAFAGQDCRVGLDSYRHLFPQ